MSEASLPQPTPEESAPAPGKRRRLWRWLGAFSGLFALLVACFCIWASSPAVERMARFALIEQLQAATGGRVEIHGFHWRLFHLEADAEGVVIHGLEAKGERPYLSIDRLDVKASLLHFFSPRILLRSLEVERPAFHLILYRNGSTNQPKPRHVRKGGKDGLETLFDLRAGRVQIENGVIDLDNRADANDFQERMAPLDLSASKLSLRLGYREAHDGAPESYHIESSSGLIHLLRGEGQRWAEELEGRMEATLDLERNAAYLRSFKLSVGKQALEVKGSLADFKHPRWQATVAGNLDLRAIEPITGFPRTPQGLATLNLTAAGEAGVFHCDGSARVENGAYIDGDIHARNFDLDTRVHFDPWKIALTSVLIRPRAGGRLSGEVLLSHWLSAPSGGAQLGPSAPEPAKQKKSKKTAAPQPPPVRPAPVHLSREGTPIDLPIDGKVKAEFQGVALDTLLDWLAAPGYERLGLDAQFSGPATASWNGGDDHTLEIGANFRISPSGRQLAGEAPATGVFNGRYTHKDGLVALRQLEVNLPQTQLRAQGRMTVFPATGPASLAVDLRSENLHEMDKTLRVLGLERNGKKGVEALPASLAGSAEFHGSWTGSLVDPRLSGSLLASDLTVATPTSENPAQSLQWDTISAKGGYSSKQIDIEHAYLRRGPLEVDLNGTLTANTPAARARRSSAPEFTENSLLHIHVRASKANLSDLEPYLGAKIPATGLLSAQIDIDGPLHALNGGGWVELEKGAIYGEPVSHLRVQGALKSQYLNIAQINWNGMGGNLAVNGGYDLASKHFQLQARATNLELARIERLQQRGLQATGRLNFTITGSGTLDDPLVEGRATVEKLALKGEPVGSIEFSGHTANRTLFYQASSRLESAKVSLAGQSSLEGAHDTSARIEFTQFNINGLLRAAHVQGLNGESSLAGYATIKGPLSDLRKLHGEARLQQLAATLEGVHLRSANGLHATIEDGRVRLDPLHITGDNTDLNVQGSLSLLEQRQLYLASSGVINLKLIESIDPDLTASGSTTFQVEARGPLANPDLKGVVEFHNGSLALEDLPNGLSQINGSLEFNRNRLEVRSLKAMTGGGQLSLAGYVAYQRGLYADLTAQGSNIRIRYPQGVSSLADLSLHLQGAQNNLLLNGNVLLTRFSISPDIDIAALAAQSNAVRPTPPPDAPSNHVRLDIHLSSAPQLNFQNAYAKLAGSMDLRVRGTLATPSLLGRVSITEGSAMVAGTRYELQHGSIAFTNPVRIQPVIDLTASARVADYDISLGAHGTPDRLSINYRSDPPLPEADVVALLALGRTQSQQRIYTQQQEQSLSNPTTDSLLGGALNATVSSRMQKLFGAASVKVDPNYLGALGASTSRIIVEEQVGPHITLTYATNMNSTAQQLLQADIAINRHVSAMISRDESGVFSMVLKVTRHYR